MSREALRQGLRDLIEAQRGTDAALDPATAALVRRFYQARDYQPVWIGDPARVAALATALSTAREQGLDFSLPSGAAAETASGGGAGQVERELALTQVALRYAAALAVGRVRLDEIESDWAMPIPVLDVAAGLERALRSGDLVSWYAGLPPSHPAYLGLKAALARYRDYVERGGWERIPDGAKLRPGMVDDRVEAIRRRLVAEGDLPEDALGDNTYDAALEEGIRRFQERHGIAVDATIGQSTIAALNVSAQARVTQIMVNLERWRTLPRDFGRSYILVNIPAEALVLVDDGVLAMGMKVVVGDRDHPTPVLETGLVATVFNPAWNIPSSIVTKEINPKLKADPDYLAKNQMIITSRGGIQQLPGARNPLGRIKFETPNRFDVYLHDTSTHASFERFARAQSHGCVRVERARDLAAYLMQPMRWTEESVDRMVAGGETRRVELSQHWRVYLLYATAFVDDDGTVEFRDDIYGRDRRLRDALQGTPRGSSTPAATARLGTSVGAF